MVKAGHNSQLQVLTVPPTSPGLSSRVILPPAPGDVWQYLETSLVVTLLSSDATDVW